MLRINFAIFLIFAFYFVNSFAAPDHQRQEVSYVTGEFHLNYCVRKRLDLRNDVLGLVKNEEETFLAIIKSINQIKTSQNCPRQVLS